jgi:hypothetical protein
MVLKTIIFASIAVGLGCTASVAGVRIPLTAAIAQCGKIADRYGDTLFGQGGETVDTTRQQSYYRSCVRAKSGQYPPNSTRKQGVRISGSATIGIVIK